jgi:hypothetical protein
MPKGLNGVTGVSHKFKNRIGSRNERLLFIEYLGVDSHKHGIWLAKCDCGNTTKTTTPHLTKSCGCLRKEKTRKLGLSSRFLSDSERLESRKISAAKQREKRKSCPVKSMAARLSRLHRHALAQVNAIKTSPTFEALGYTAFEFKEHIEKQFVDGMSWENMSEWQIDHIYPISLAKDIDDVKRLNQLSNLRPLWAKENNLKKNKLVNLI